ncbi:hypothetical protein [Desertihabitans aurantiacus]|uniref:hypothetical protein n=1 Tax=Desertihabitans aurantiacus TaxID=2282477 RepID=UPI000DF72953|nr:hypothetical protein [Desertihabitans aurantiacus]
MSPTAGSWWSRLRGRRLPADRLAALREVVGAEPRVLRWAESDRGLVAALPDVLAVDRGPEAGWELLGWHQIEHGGWSGPDRLLRWTTAEGRRGQLRLADPGRLPEVFRERVNATIVVQRDVTDAATGAEFTLSGRRALPASGATATPTALEWRVHLKRGTSASAPGVAEATQRAMRELRREYDISPHGC